MVAVAELAVDSWETVDSALMYRVCEQFEGLHAGVPGFDCDPPDGNAVTTRTPWRTCSTSTSDKLAVVAADAWRGGTGLEMGGVRCPAGEGGGRTRDSGVKGCGVAGIDCTSTGGGTNDFVKAAVESEGVAGAPIVCDSAHGAVASLSWTASGLRPGLTERTTRTSKVLACLWKTCGTRWSPRQSGEKCRLCVAAGVLSLPSTATHMGLGELALRGCATVIIAGVCGCTVIVRLGAPPPNFWTASSARLATAMLWATLGGLVPR